MKILPEYLLIVFKHSMTSETLHKHFHNFQTFVKNLDLSIFFLLSFNITSTSDLQPSTAISNLPLGKSVLNKFKPY